MLYGVTMGADGVSQIVSRRLPRDEPPRPSRSALRPGRVRAADGRALGRRAGARGYPDDRRGRGRRFDPVGLWPANEWDAWGSTPPLKDLYCGAAGVIWALDALVRRGHAETGIDLAAAAERTLELWREAPDLALAEIELPAARESSLLCGGGSPARQLASHASPATSPTGSSSGSRENRDNEFEELLWGSPGTLLVAQGDA